MSFSLSLIKQSAPWKSHQIVGSKAVTAVVTAAVSSPHGHRADADAARGVGNVNGAPSVVDHAPLDAHDKRITRESDNSRDELS
ncbi:hypothetical protein EVAR_60193_1 [Eumeta japonica]|uniref:Uncharacterized protein n=1 Tax=Eumeta variegata TaxID=151549 RepID=A0A4C1ZBD6_EUMVA|nr:hypothetical protein EVAR_60193_1 [Eumeta japonica]